MINIIKAQLQAGQIAGCTLSSDQCKTLLDVIERLENKQIYECIRTNECDIRECLYLLRTERNERVIQGRLYAEYCEHLILPGEFGPTEVFDAENLIINLGLKNRLKRIYFTKKFGFVGVFVISLIESGNVNRWIEDLQNELDSFD